MLAILVGLVSLASGAFGITVSGISSGAYFSSQFHVAYSASVTGAGIIAGGPYYCGENSVNHAEIACLSVPSQISLPRCEKYAESASAAGTIDNLSNLQKASVYIFAGTRDTVVNPECGKAAQQFYQKYVTNGNIVTNYNTPAEHSWVTNTYGNTCVHLGSPYMNNCNVDAAGIMLSQFLGTLQPRTNPVSGNLHTFSQSAYGDISTASMSKTGYIYIPNGCVGSTTCRVHIAFHGCLQSWEKIGNVFVQYSGLNDWAESNNIVILYPQLTTELIKNPQGCWDFWGYTGSNYALKSGKQMSIVYSMANKLPTMEEIEEYLNLIE
jgi:poly(3-hydroxybutyrate) depolymerase